MSPLRVLQALILIGALSSITFTVRAELVLVVHKNNPTTELSRSQVIDLYMGKFVAFPDGSKAVPLDIEDDLGTRKQFYDALISMPLARVNAYWSKVKFSGRARPPMRLQDEDAVLAFVVKTENAIAYIHENSVSADVKVVYRFDE